MQKSRWPFGHRDFDFGMLRISNRLLALLTLCLHVLTAVRMTMGGFDEDRHRGLSLRLMVVSGQAPPNPHRYIR